jgi:hypothetical protein
LKLIEATFPEWTVENPGEQRHRNGYRRFLKKKGNGMLYFTEKVLPSCEGGIFLPFRDGRWGAGIFSEARILLAKRRPVWLITLSGRATRLQSMKGIVPLSVSETRQRVYKKGGTIRPY